VHRLAALGVSGRLIALAARPPLRGAGLVRFAAGTLEPLAVPFLDARELRALLRQDHLAVLDCCGSGARTFFVHRKCRDA
jgi:hypothetical protein